MRPVLAVFASTEDNTESAPIASIGVKSNAPSLRGILPNKLRIAERAQKTSECAVVYLRKPRYDNAYDTERCVK